MGPIKKDKDSKENRFLSGNDVTLIGWGTQVHVLREVAQLAQVLSSALEISRPVLSHEIAPRGEVWILEAILAHRGEL
jgi:hypothetical protein